jgi:L-threonylcarbamoyladenylate synthase
MDTKISIIKDIHNDYKSIKEAASVIKEGGVVAFPTETVYGLGADALNPLAVKKIF